MPSYEPVEAVLRSLRILEAMSMLDQASVSVLHAQTGINRATVVRMLETLEFAGYVNRDADGKYRLSSKVLALRAGFQVGSELAGLSGPILEKLQSKVGWPSDLALYEGSAMVIVGNSPETQRLSFNRPPGFRADIFGTSLGLAYLAFASDEERRQASALLANNGDPWNELARDPKAADKIFKQVRRLGYAMIDPRASLKYYNGVLGTIGVPVLVGGRSVAAMNIIFLAAAVPKEIAIKQLLPPLQNAAATLAEAALPLYEHH